MIETSDYAYDRANDRRNLSKRRAMTRYIVRQLEPTWVECLYAVEADSEEEATDKVREGECTFLGHTCAEYIDGLDTEGQQATPDDGNQPVMLHPEHDECVTIWPPEKAPA